MAEQTIKLARGTATLDITQLLQRLRDGDREAMEVVIPLVYDELKKLARSHLRREAPGNPLQTTALVHEVFLRLARSHHPAYENRAHFYGIASRLMRQVLVDAARARAAEKRGTAQEVAVADLPEWHPRPNQQLLAMEDALRQLEQVDELKGRLIEMRFFGGMTAGECAVALSMPVHIVRRELRLAYTWLRSEMSGAQHA